MKLREVFYFWTISRELHDCRARGDREGARMAAEELEGIAMYATDPGIRHRAAALASM